MQSREPNYTMKSFTGLSFVTDDFMVMRIKRLSASFTVVSLFPELDRVVLSKGLLQQYVLFSASVLFSHSQNSIKALNESRCHL